MTHSLQKRLSLTLTLAIVSASLIATLVANVLAFLEARASQDDALEASAAGVAHSLTQTAASLHFKADISEDELLDFLIVAFPVTRTVRPVWLPADLSPGRYTLWRGDEPIRVLLRDWSPDQQIVAAQSPKVNLKLIVRSTLSALAPLLILLPVLIWLAEKIVRRELAPVNALATQADRQSAERPQALPEQEVPEEIQPFMAAINRLLGRISRLLEQQQRFIADAAHELRSPLTALSVQAQNLENAESIEAMRERVAPLKAGIQRAQHQTEQLLGLAKTQAGNEASRSVDLTTMARELIAAALPVAEARGVDLGLDEEAHLSLTTAPETLRLILKNALENAITYTPRQGVVTLRISEANRGQPDHAALIEVLDNGPGIPLAERQRVFDPFYRIAGAGAGESSDEGALQRMGSGLGLAIAGDAAARLGGVIRLLDRAEGTGLVFQYQQLLTPLKH